MTTELDGESRPMVAEVNSMRTQGRAPSSIGTIPFVGLSIMAALFNGASSASGQWSSDPNVNTPVCVEAGSQSFPVITTDGARGAIIAWQDGRSGNWDVFAQ